MKWFAYKNQGKGERYFSLTMTDSEFLHMHGRAIIHEVHERLVQHLTEEWLKAHGATVLEGLEPGVVTEAVSQLVRQRVADKVLR